MNSNHRQPFHNPAKRASVNRAVPRPIPQMVMRDALLVWETVDVFGIRDWNWLKLAPVGFNTHLQHWVGGPLGRVKFHMAYIRSEAVNSWEQARQLILAWTSHSGPELSEAALESVKLSFDRSLYYHASTALSRPSAIPQPKNPIPYNEAS